METNLQKEDLLIKLRAKLNEEKIKLWEPPYKVPGDELPQTLRDLSKKYASALSIDEGIILEALHELQLHSIDRSKANAEFLETGVATFRVKATVPGLKPQVLKVQKKLDCLGGDLVTTIAVELSVEQSRVKLICNGRVIKASLPIQEQGLKNGSQLMALVMNETPEEVKKEDAMYMEMKSTRDDAQLLSECVEDLADDDEYMKIEDQSGNTLNLCGAERRALMVGLTLHERGRAAAKLRDFSLALLLLLEADKQMSECNSSLLSSVDNWAVLQLDIAWCYLCLQNLASAGDAALRLRKAEEAFKKSYGENHQRLLALKGTAANERVLIMRLYLLQGIVAYHQNKRTEARILLEKAEVELNALRVEPGLVAALVELGWSGAAARRGLRARAGDVDAAHHYLMERRREREHHRAQRRSRLLGCCADGSAVSERLVEALQQMGFPRALAARALRNTNNVVADAVRIIHETPEMLESTDAESSDDAETSTSGDSPVEPDNKLIAELEAMGYETSQAAAALRATHNQLPRAALLLADAGGHLPPHAAAAAADEADPSTSSGATAKRKRKSHKKEKRRQEREQALRRLKNTIQTEEDDYLDTSLADEEEFLVQYKSLL